MQIDVPIHIFCRLSHAAYRHGQTTDAFAAEVLRVYLDAAYPESRSAAKSAVPADENNPPGRCTP